MARGEPLGPRFRLSVILRHLQLQEVEHAVQLGLRDALVGHRVPLVDDLRLYALHVASRSLVFRRNLQRALGHVVGFAMSLYGVDAALLLAYVLHEARLEHLLHYLVGNGLLDGELATEVETCHADGERQSERQPDVLVLVLLLGRHRHVDIVSARRFLRWQRSDVLTHEALGLSLGYVAREDEREVGRIAKLLVPHLYYLVGRDLAEIASVSRQHALRIVGLYQLH